MKYYKLNLHVSMTMKLLHILSNHSYKMTQFHLDVMNSCWISLF